MAVCKFFEQGYCRFGEKCRNEHITQSQNRYGMFGNPSSRPGFSGGSGGSGANRYGREQAPFSLDAKVIESDLKNDRPIWPLSCYGPGVGAPRQLIEGDVEQSPDEMRYLFYLARADGNPQRGQQVQMAAAAKMEEAIQRVLGDLDGAIEYVSNPNIGVNRNTKSAAPASSTPSAFGAASRPALSQPAFGKPAFGQPSTPQVNPSPFGAPSVGTFGKPAFGQPAFGQPSTPAATAAPAAPAASGFGKPAFGTPAFGAPSTLSRPSPFGAPPSAGQQSSPFAQAASNTSPFGQPSGAGASNPSPFAQASKPPAAPAFGQPAFGQPGGGQQASPFGQPSSQQTSPFAQSSQPPQSSPFAQAGQTSTPFGQPSQPAAQASPFGQPSQPSQPAPFGQPSSQSQASPFGNPTASASATPFAASKPSGTTFGVSAGKKGKTYAQLFPEGPPVNNPNTEPSIEAYLGNDQAFKEAFDYAKQHGRFKDGIMPWTGPKHEWVAWA